MIGAGAGAGAVTLDDIFSTRSVYGVGLGHIYNPADCTFCPSMIGAGAGAAPIFLYKLSEYVTT